MAENPEGERFTPAPLPSGRIAAGKSRPETARKLAHLFPSMRSMNFSDTDIATLEAVGESFACQLTEKEPGYRYTLPVGSDYSLHVRRDYHTQKARFPPLFPDSLLVVGQVAGINASLIGRLSPSRRTSAAA